MKISKETHKIHNDNDHYRITIQQPVTISIPKTQDNKKILSVFLRHCFNDSSEHYFTFQEIANVVELNDRRDVDNYYREFNRKKGDFKKLISRKVDLLECVDLIQSLIIQNPFLQPTELYQMFLKKHPDYKMSYNCFVKYLSQTNTHVILQSIHKHLNKNNTWDSEYLMSYLLAHIENPVIQKKIMNMNIATKNNSNEQFHSKINLSTDNKSYLVKFLIGAGLSYSLIAFILGIKKSYVNKLAHRMEDFHYLLLSSIDKYSGSICVDEKYVKLNGKFGFVFSAVDKDTGIPLLVMFFEEKTHISWQTFFTIFKSHYTTPKLIVSDGCPSLGKARQLVFPHVPFQYCKFHKIKNMIKNAFKNVKDMKKVREIIDKVKQVFSRETIGGRRKALLELEKMLFGELKEYFNEHFKKEWKHLTKSLTNNAAERWNRKIKRIVSGKYGLKSPKTIQMLMNCLWFKELIMRGHSHLSNETIISKLNITDICQDMIPETRLEHYFSTNKQKKVA